MVLYNSSFACPESCRPCTRIPVTLPLPSETVLSDTPSLQDSGRDSDISVSILYSILSPHLAITTFTHVQARGTLPFGLPLDSRFRGNDRMPWVGVFRQLLLFMLAVNVYSIGTHFVCFLCLSLCIISSCVACTEV